MLIPEEEHERDGVVELVHLLEVRDLVEIADVDDGEVLDAVCDLVEHFILAHAVRIPVATEADDDEAVFFGHDGLVDMPAGYEMRDDDGAHGVCVLMKSELRASLKIVSEQLRCVRSKSK